ncbi:DUF5103 domain-containing protein [Bacteroides sp. OttesenSCG-928-J23]|nr:DUF5103 domain-containing protein [Bacteroides sp. OttesenSCG-928-J23]
MHIKKLCITTLCLVLLLQVKAQQNEVFFSDIHTLQTIVNQDSNLPPILQLNSNDRIEISFDCLGHNYRRYQYVISHHNADWTPSGLFELDYLSGFNNLPIEEYEPSVNTTMLYTHYSFSLPNNEVQLTKSGNYTVTVYEENQPHSPAFKACFSVAERKVTVSAHITTNTDIDFNKSHQQLSFTVNYAGYDIRNPQAEVKVQVLQNGRTDNMVTNLSPTYLTSSELKYEHNKQLIFPAGNEYRRFEITTTRYLSPGVESIKYFDPYYHATLYPDEPRTRNYIYDEDQNGRYVIRYNQAIDHSTEADYFLVHFSFPRETPFAEGNLYLQGAFTHNLLNEKSMLRYNVDTKAYESVQVLKQGAYNYYYLFVPNDHPGKGNTTFTEGNFYQTENEYLILIYHRPFNERHDKLIGYLVL